MAATAHVDHKRTPGRMVRDAGTFHQILDGSDITSSTNSGWLDVGFAGDCIFHAEVGTVTGTDPTLDVIVEIADDSSGNGAEVKVNFTQFGDNDDTEAKSAEVCVDKRYVRASYTIGGTSTPTFPVTLTMRPVKDHYDTANSLTLS